MTIATTKTRTFAQTHNTGLFAGVTQWNARAAQRRELRKMEPHRLADLGITQAEADIEAAKPFWVA